MQVKETAHPGAENSSEREATVQGTRYNEAVLAPLTSMSKHSLCREVELRYCKQWLHEHDQMLVRLGGCDPAAMNLFTSQVQILF